MSARSRSRSPLASAALLALTTLGLAGCSATPQQTALAPDALLASTPNIRWCGTLALPGKWQDGTPVGGLSDLGWDADESLLFLISDRGWLHRARLSFSGSGELRGYEPLDTYPLRDVNGAILRSRRSDAEALALEHANDGIRGNTQLVIGFEGAPAADGNGDARWQRFYPSGLASEPPHRPAALSDVAANGGLEALTDTPDHGLIGGIEQPPTGWPPKLTRLFTLDGQHSWRYPLSDDPHAALTALETLDGDLLALERAFTPPASLVIRLRRAHLASDGSVAVTDLARLANGDGWSVDNFEGLTRLGGRRYLMVSDDNFSLMQRTLLTCFAVVEPGVVEPTAAEPAAVEADIAP
ncbi:esterase-like activity of phytase family protein [Salinicola sp. DM10]|uniref:esterase-like activity of phytase family protein n=1 Tax=Salinicola sp. DM10 TaxID=2815721 RepID=UPI001A8F051E|nr:esterase-like activity of phytase family protein [Salinicola sp. DM10]MCE3027690.1 esterase-like activity of phytase family protein [Salinicola sp. DM10]